MENGYEPAVITAAETASEILYIGELRGIKDITNLKLQKLIYFANLVHISIFDTPLFADSIRAWELGPVAGAIYHDYKAFGNRPILGRSQKSSNEKLEQIVTFVMDLLGWKLASDLVNITHLDSVYDTAMKRGDRTMKHSKSEAKSIISDQMKSVFDRAKYVSLAGKLDPSLAVKDRPYIDDYQGVSPQDRKKIWGVIDE